MSKRHAVWLVRWTHYEYGGPQSESGGSFFLTREAAITAIEAREADGDRTWFADGYRYKGSGPSQEFVDDSTYQQLLKSQG